LPFLLHHPLRTAVVVLSIYWLAMMIVDLVRDPAAHTLVNFGLGSASIFAVQLFALLFSALIRDAARDARTETDALRGLLTRQRIAEAVQADYQQRYARLLSRIIAVLVELAQGRAATADLRHRAGVEEQRLRMLFDERMIAHPLLQRLRSIVEAAQNRGIDVSTHLDPKPPRLAAATIDRLATPIARVAALPVATMRLTLMCAGDEVTTSLTCTAGPGLCALAGAAVVGDDGVELVDEGDVLWLRVRQSVQGDDHDDGSVGSATSHIGRGDR
jgi:hypothetical protein